MLMRFMRNWRSWRILIGGSVSSTLPHSFCTRWVLLMILKLPQKNVCLGFPSGAVKTVLQHIVAVGMKDRQHQKCQGQVIRRLKMVYHSVTKLLWVVAGRMM